MIKWLLNKYKTRKRIKRVQKSVERLTLAMENMEEVNPNNLIPFKGERNGS